MKNLFLTSLVISSLFLLGILLSNNVEAKQMQISTLSGYETIPSTNTTGIGMFIMGPASAHGISYTIILADIDKVTDVNLQVGKKGENGDIAVKLFNSSKPTDNIKGVLISSQFNSTDINNPEFDPANPEQDNIYVNVITTDHPQGELRGQLHWIYPFFDLFQDQREREINAQLTDEAQKRALAKSNLESALAKSNLATERLEDALRAIDEFRDLDSIIKRDLLALDAAATENQEQREINAQLTDDVQKKEH
jgi:hypothetical protein